MPDKQTIAFTTSLTEQEWEAGLNGWRCPVLKIPGAKVEDVLAGGARADKSWYEVIYEHGVIRWVRPDPPGRALVFIRLTEELTTTELSHWWKKFGIIVPIISTLLLVASTFIHQTGTGPTVNPNAPHPGPNYTCDNKVRILVPGEGQRVPVFEEVKGTFQDVPQGHRIWTMVYPPNIGRFYPQTEAELTGNTWSSKVVIGLDHEVERTFHIYVALADEKAQDALNIYARRARETNESPGIKDLPAGVRICQFISVVRK